MTHVREIFSREIERDIKEVIKVDDKQSILEEIEEYVPTDHIEEELVKTLDAFQDTINSPSEEINIWVSGFFGSGKSSFAKVLGYLLANPEVGNTSVAPRFFELNDIPQALALLTTIHTASPTEAVLLDLNTSQYVLDEGEPIVLPVYRTLLKDLGYSTDFTLSELEFSLEGEGSLNTFRSKYEEVYSISWEAQRDINLAKNRASRVLHELDKDTYPSADSWSNTAGAPPITAKWFATRALDMLGRRRPEKARLVLIVDEVGQYVSRSTDRMRHLQGLAEECQKTKGKLWLLATSQEKLTDVVDSLEGKQTELAKAQDRFPIRVDLLPSDIDEVTSRRVLDKNATGSKKVRELLDADRHKLTTSVTLHSDRHQPFADDDFVRLYPLVPYQLQVLIDAVSARRAQGGAPQTMGGSNRTLIRHAQQLISNPTVGLASQPLGDLVTLDCSYVLLEDVIPTAWRHEVDQVAAKHGERSLEARIMRVIALCTDVPGVPLTAPNLAVMLHPSISADPIESEVRAALNNLVGEDRVREGDEGYRLQSPEQKDWEKTRRGIDMKPGGAVRLRKLILKNTLGSLTVSKSRTFKVRLFAEREKMSEGDITLDIRDDTDLEGLRKTSRSEDSRHHIYWAYQTVDDTWEALTELHRSNEIIDRYDHSSQTDAQRILLAEERKRRDRAMKSAEQLLARDITGGTTVFDGTTDDAPNGELRSSAERLVTSFLDRIYPQLATFAGSFKKSEILKILQADHLDGIPDQFGAEGLGLFTLTASGRQLVTDSGPLESVMSHIQARKQYGEDQNGGQLERHFAAPPFGAPVESIQAVLAAAMRGGMLEVVSQAARITSPTDRRLEQVFGNLPKFRSASFRPAQNTGPSIEIRGEVSEWLATLTGEPLSIDLHDLAAAGRSTFEPLRQPCTEARSSLSGAGLAVTEGIITMDELLDRVLSTDDELVVSTMHERSADLQAGRTTVTSVSLVVNEEMDSLRAARLAVTTADGLTDPAANGWKNDLGELLARARYGDDLVQIKSLTTTIENAATAEQTEIKSSLQASTDSAISKLRTRYPSVDDEAFAEVTSSLAGLSDPENLAVLRANVHAVQGARNVAADGLDVLSTTKEVRHIRVSEVWSSPITSIDDLEVALARLREAVLAQLDEDAEVRFR